MSPADFLIALYHGAIAYLDAARNSPAEIMAIVAVLAGSAFVIISSFVKTMIPLRWLAIGHNLGFIAYGALHPAIPMLVLHVLLLPLNLLRLREMIQVTRRVTAAERKAALSGIWLRPYMRTATMPDGAVLFKKGDRGNRLYLLAEGEIEFVEFGNRITAGEIFGEIAFFSPDRQRRGTARCKGKCVVLSIDERTMRELIQQNPAFGFQLTTLVAGRLSADVSRYTADLAAAKAEVQRLTEQLKAQPAT